MFEIRLRYPVTNDGWTLLQTSNQTTEILHPGSGNTTTETGLISAVRAPAIGVQDFTDVGQGNQPIWLIYSNLNRSETYLFDCKSKLVGRASKALVSPFNAGTTVKNLLYPYDEWFLEQSEYKLGTYFVGSNETNGCLPKMNLTSHGFKAFVPKDKWLNPSPRITGFVPGHDARLTATARRSETQDVPIEIHFSEKMDCEQIKNAVSLDSTTEIGVRARLDATSVKCKSVSTSSQIIYSGFVPTTWIFAATVTDLGHGVHTLSLRNGSAADGSGVTNVSFLADCSHCQS